MQPTTLTTPPLPAGLIPYDISFVPPDLQRGGMDNTGVTCWWVSLLQALLGVSSLTEIMFTHEDEFAENGFAKAYIAFLSDVFSGKSTSSSNIKLFAAFNLRLAAKSNIKLVDGQQCVSEGFDMFIDMLDNRRVEKLFWSSYEDSITCRKCANKKLFKRDRAFYLAIPYDLRDDRMFGNFMRIHEGEGEPYTCEKCNQRELGVKHTHKLKQLSEVIVLMLNKFPTKTNMYFPQSLSFLATNGSTLKYKLVAKIEHSGSMNPTTFSSGGHYWAHSLGEESWICYNDNQMPVPSNGNPTANTFMVMYHLVA